ncbi:UDP-N-acetylmuramoyl-tripeptide--D-alanyl-D-alanine ligase [Marinicauda algicola]|uniref:UDP-N-acetylmuramoyl-tripeptide--D-alanyl-D-alanine ligase n=1 Tax=Marinicauda algicola TaxID=2029849 RepID=A0A4S2H3C0_9PROT|nr:UDP-N-acetylmuramoyl-tripeptide--D-alanyl-D-alanine ligase [Marinicauda algicola]TGY89993.1 UDP-N-acetylmuramoyl-tripeptide--D-alanyl-D-alanine ligase [Marinicauda algicola]
MNRPLWTAKDAARATGGRLEGGEWTATGVSIDSRTIEPGDLFVALSDQRDGHEFAQAALDAGAVAALVSKPGVCDGPRLVVPDVLQALRDLGAAARDRCGAVRVAVTGSVGKTSVKEWIAAAFRAAGPAHWSVKSYNNHWGVPLTLARMPAGTRHAVFEMGMNHAGEIRALTAQVRPHVAVITKIAPAHLENLGSMEAIADAKSEIFEGLEPDGIAVIPADDEFRDRLAGHVNASRAGFLLDFGAAPKAAVRVVSYTDGPDGGTGRLDVLGREIVIRVGASGAHQGINAAAVMAACVAAGLEPEIVAEVLASQTAAPGRGARFTLSLPDGGEALIVDDSYNANPASMTAAIAGLANRQPARGGRRIAVLGEMLELGPQSEAMHAALAEPLKTAGVDIVIGVGRGMQTLLSALPKSVEGRQADNAGEGLERLGQILRDGDVVLIKGSNASGVHKIVASLHEGRFHAPSNA